MGAVVAALLRDEVSGAHGGTKLLQPGGGVRTATATATATAVAAIAKVAGTDNN